MLTTVDRILGGTIIIEQPKDGYRVAIDPIFLSAVINPDEGSSILDVGCGVGATSLCLAYRQPYLNIHGFDIQPELVRLASQNAMRNQLRDSLEFMVGSLQKPPPRLIPSSYSYVVSNPPFYDGANNSRSPNLCKDTSHVEKGVALKEWLFFCLKMLRLKGVLTLIHVPDRLNEILESINHVCGNIKIYPLWPKKGECAKRVIIQAEKGSKAPLRLMPGIILHQEDGSYTMDADMVLRGKAILSL
jgi:tRNA1(Val) A37 N6-methylase TrmN6